MRAEAESEEGLAAIKADVEARIGSVIALEKFQNS
jgi:hypothetical protein